MRLFLAIRVFFRTLVDAAAARRIADALDGSATPKLTDGTRGGDAAPAARAGDSAPKVKQPTVPRAPARSDAIALLATLQREARFVDFVREPLDGYTDAQIGAVARDVHRQCGAAIQRIFALAPVVADEEGATIEVPSGFDAGQFRLSGNVAGAAPFRGALVHAGWEATKCDLGSWSGSDAAARVVAPAEVEVT
jgi:hypothetical protein